MKAKFGMKKFGQFLVLALALVCMLSVAGCGNQDKKSDAQKPDTQDVQPSDTAPETPEQPDDAEPEEPETPTPRITDVSQTDPEVHSALLKLDFDEGEIPDSLYYRTTTDETGLACYEIQPADSENPILIPMSNTVIYMLESDSEKASADEEAYYEQITLTYMLDEQPVESVQYQLFVPNALSQVNGATDGDVTPSDNSGVEIFVTD